MAALLAILTTVAAFGMIRDESPVTASGVLVAVDGSPIVGATVSLVNGIHPDVTAISDEHGAWWLQGGHRIDPHSVTVTAAGFIPVATPLGSTALLSLHSFPSLSGRVVDDAGAPVSRALVQLVRPHDKTLWTRTTALDGTFDLAESFAPGQFSISITAADHDPFRGLLHLQADTVHTLKAVLVRQIGTVTVTSNPPGLTPLLDGRPLTSCRTPCSADVLVGKHVLAFETELYVPWTQAIELHNRQQLPVGAVLERKQGVLNLSSTGGDLTVDGIAVGPGSWSGRLPTGPHVVSHSSDAAWPFARTVTVLWNQTTTLSVTSNETAIVPGDQAAFLAGLNSYLRNVGGEYGIYLKDLKSGLELGSRQDEVMEAASDIKVPLALYLLNQVETSKINLTDKVTLQDSDFMSGTGSLDGTANSGDQYSVQDLLTLMITISDNTAWQALMRVLTPEATDAYVASIGAPNCHQVDDNCTAHELGILFEGIYRGSLLKPAQNQLLLDLLSNTIFNERIPYYLVGTHVAHKTGADGGVMNDAGIVYLAGNPFIISMFTVTDDGQTGIQATRDVTRAFAHFVTPAPK